MKKRRKIINSNSNYPNSPFYELPESLVDEMLCQCDSLENNLSNAFRKLHENKDGLRRILYQEGYLNKEVDLSISPVHPTTCGIDGSYAIEKLLSTDMAAIAAVAVEGLTPPNERRHWPKPHHMSSMYTLLHSESTSVVARAIMMCMEIDLAAQAPHDTVFLDGSLTTPFIYFNQALNKTDSVSKKLSADFLTKFPGILNSYLDIVTSQRTDKIYVGAPKYTTKKEITQNILHIEGHEDRGCLSFILNPGEYIGPVEMLPPSSKWHIDRPPEGSMRLITKIIAGLKNLYVVYYRPYSHFPALRLEISQSIAKNNHRLAILFESLKLQCGAPGIMEPYPLYLADRMVRHLNTALPAIRRTTTQEMALKWGEDLGNIYLAMHGYRTEWGK